MPYRVKIYQINTERDKNRAIFAGSDYLMTDGKKLEIDASIYDEVFSGELESKEPEKLFVQFNIQRHPLHRGQSMSVSDVVVTEDGAFFCDSVGFKKISFDESKTQKTGNLLRIVYVEPGKAAYEAEIVYNLRGMQQAVCGELIEQILLDKKCAYVGNDEAKLMGMKGNRRYGKGGIIAGPFFICGYNSGEYRSLTDKEVKRYLRRFKNPEDISDEETQVCVKSKNFNKAFEYLKNAVMSYRTDGSSGVGMDHRQIFAVLEEYFALDDAEIARKEAEAKAKAEQERKANAAKRAAKTKAEKKSSAKDSDNAKKKAPKSAKAKKEKKAQPPQISFDDLLGGVC